VQESSIDGPLKRFFLYSNPTSRRVWAIHIYFYY